MIVIKVVRFAFCSSPQTGNGHRRAFGSGGSIKALCSSCKSAHGGSYLPATQSGRQYFKSIAYWVFFETASSQSSRIFRFIVIVTLKACLEMNVSVLCLDETRGRTEEIFFRSDLSDFRRYGSFFTDGISQVFNIVPSSVGFAATIPEHHSASGVDNGNSDLQMNLI